MSGLMLIDEITYDSRVQSTLAGASGSVNSGVITVQVRPGDVVKCETTTLWWEEETAGGGATHDLYLALSDVISGSAKYRTVTAYPDLINNVIKTDVGVTSIRYHTLRSYSTRVITEAGDHRYGAKVVFNQANVDVLTFERGCTTVEHYRPTLPIPVTDGRFPTENAGTRWNVT